MRQSPPAFDEAGEISHYYFVWTGAGDDARLLYRSKGGPDRIEPPTASEAEDGEESLRTEETRRELYFTNRRGHVVLVGRDISSELTAIRGYGVKVVAAGGCLLFAGLLLSYWLSRRALTPIGVISSTAKEIAEGNLDERIPAADRRSELGELGGVLNDTFDRLEDAYERQVRFTSDAAHELRTPISVVLTETQSVLNRKRPAEEYETSLEVCRDAARSMRSLVESLLALAQFDAGTGSAIREIVDLELLAQNCLNSVQPSADGCGIELSSDLRPIICECDPMQIAQVLNNLLENAIAYCRKGRRVSVRLRDSDGMATFEVEDNGEGIDAKHLPHLFDRFYRVDQSRSDSDSHSGLGLAICKAIIESHGGTVEVRSTLGEGSVFAVSIPVTDSEQAT